tara:strand:- start:9587 stop:11323 length:1737 start_codon:yes stop_codon:yes gene_type:complete
MSGGRSQQNKIIEHQNEQIRKQYEMDLKNYEFQYGLKKDEDGNFVQQYDEDGSKAGAIQDQYEFAVEGLNLRKQADQETNDYQMETARQNWEQGKSMQEFQWQQEDRIYQKNIDQYENQLEFNSLEYGDAIARERTVLDERFIEAAFQNQGLIQDLYEQTGTAGFAKTQAKLGLLAKEETAEYQKQKQLINLKQNTGAAKYRTAEQELDILNRRGETRYQQAGIGLNLAREEADARFRKANILLDAKTQTQLTDYQNEMIRREQNKQSLDSAHAIEQQTIRGLQAAGQAQLSQAGRSQGKAVQMIMAELGRNNNYIAESLVRGQDAAEARMRQNKINNLNVIQKAALAEQQIDVNSVMNIQKAMMGVQEADRNLKMGDARSQLNMDQIKKAVMDQYENAEVDVRKIEQDLKQAQSSTGLSLKEIDFKTANVGSRFKTNQDILKASLESAVATSDMNMKDIYRAKQSADLAAEARKMLDPNVGREDIDLENFRPLDIPLPKYQNPLEPKIPPAPIQGAMQSQMGMGAAIPGAALGGAAMGFGAYSAATAGAFGPGLTAASAAGPLGLAVGLGAFALGLF